MTNDQNRLYVKPTIGVVRPGETIPIQITLLYGRPPSHPDRRSADEISKKKIAIMTYEELSNDWKDEDLSSLIKKQPENVIKYEFRVTYFKSRLK